jgi:hypothetical protein
MCSNYKSSGLYFKILKVYIICIPSTNIHHKIINIQNMQTYNYFYCNSSRYYPLNNNYIFNTKVKCTQISHMAILFQGHLCKGHRSATLVFWTSKKHQDFYLRLNQFQEKGIHSRKYLTGS